MSLYLLGDLAVLVKGVDIPLRISILLPIGLYSFYTIKPSILSDMNNYKFNKKKKKRA